MDDRTYSDAELERYFSSPTARHAAPGPVGGDGGAAPAPAQSGGDGGPPSRRPGAAPPAARSSPAPRPPAPPRPATPAATAPPPGDPVRRRANRIFRNVLIGLGVFALGVLAFFAWLATDLPSLEQIENPRNLLSTVVYTSDDQELARYYSDENRTWVRLDSISPHVVDALIATEDRDFYEHWGVDMMAFLAVAKGAILEGDLRGASTVTMQLARNLYAEQVDYAIGDRSPTRKLKEILTAIQLERTYTKDEIIEFYLNTVPWGYNAYGIQSAAETYFTKDASELAPEEAATLIGMLAATTRYNPVNHPEAAQVRRNIVLQNMVTVGVLAEADHARLREAPIALTFRRYSHTDNLAPHFAEVLRQWWRAWCRENGYDPYGDGLVIRTTIDSRLQRLAQEAVDAEGPGLQAVVDYEWSGGGGLGSTTAPYLRRMPRDSVSGAAAPEAFRVWWSRNRRVVDEYVQQTERFADLTRSGRTSREDALRDLRANDEFMDSLKTARTRLEAGLVAMEPSSGRIRAWVGGRSFIADKYDHVGQARRQPGSTFKAFAYTAALEEGFSPSTPVLDAPFTWGDWRPQNSGGGYSGYMSIRQALAHSKNVVAARLTRELNPRTVAQYAQRMGIRSPLEPVRSIALGTNDVSLLEMAAGYATIASGGVYHGPPMMGNGQANHDIPPHIELAVDRIEDRYGNVVAEFDHGGREVLNRSRAYDMQDIMRGTLDFGTARGFRSRYEVGDLDLAGKTGTTQESADGWFMVMHPDLVVGSWVGFNDRRIVFRSSYWGQGGHSALLYVGNFLERLQASPFALDEEREFEKPEDYEEPGNRRASARGGSDYIIRRRRGGEPTGRSGARSGGTSNTPNASPDDRPARELLDRWRRREGDGNSGGSGNSGSSSSGGDNGGASGSTSGGASGGGNARGRIGW